MISTGSSLERVSGSERVRRRTVVGAAAIFTAIALLPSVIWYWHAHQIAETFYPHHFFGAGGIRIESFSWYLHIAQQTFGIQSHAGSLSDGALRIVRHAVANRSYSRLFHWWLAAMIVFIVVVGYGESPPMVPTSAGSDRRCLCRCRMCLCWVQNLFAFCCNHIVNRACSQLPNSCLRLCPTIL